MVYAISAPTNGEKVRAAIREEMDKLRKGGVTEEEVRRAVKGYLDTQQTARSSDPALAGMLEETSRTGRTLEFTAQLEEKIRALTPEQVNAALRRHIDPDRLFVVHAGDFGTE